MLYGIITFLVLCLSVISTMQYKNAEHFYTSGKIRKQTDKIKNLKQDLIILKCTNQDTSYTKIELVTAQNRLITIQEDLKGFN